MRRDPHYFLPTTGKRLPPVRHRPGGDEAAVRRLLLRARLARQPGDARRDRQAARRRRRRTWLEEPLSIEETAEKYVRQALRQAFVDLCRKPVGDYLDRFEFKSDLCARCTPSPTASPACYGSWDTPGTGMNFLIHNMCRLPGSDGTWMIVKGGMGTVTRMIAEDARRSRRDHRDQQARRVAVASTADASSGVVLADGRASSRADVVVVQRRSVPHARARRQGAAAGGVQPAPRRLREATGSTFKVNLALRGLPKFTCLPEDRGQYGPTIHLLPDEKDVMRAHARKASRRCRRGELDPVPDHRVVHPHDRRSVAQGRRGQPQLRALRAVGAVRRSRARRGSKRKRKYVKQLLVDLRSLRAGDERPRRRHLPAAPDEDRAALRHHARPHPPRRQRLRLRRSPAVRDADRRALLVQRGRTRRAVIGAAGHNAANRVLTELSLKIEEPELFHPPHACSGRARSCSAQRLTQRTSVRLRAPLRATLRVRAPPPIVGFADADDEGVERTRARKTLHATPAKVAPMCGMHRIFTIATSLAARRVRSRLALVRNDHRRLRRAHSARARLVFHDDDLHARLRERNRLDRSRVHR